MRFCSTCCNMISVCVSFNSSGKEVLFSYRVHCDIWDCNNRLSLVDLHGRNAYMYACFLLFIKSLLLMRLDCPSPTQLWYQVCTDLFLLVLMACYFSIHSGCPLFRLVFPFINYSDIVYDLIKDLLSSIKITLHILITWNYELIYTTMKII